MMKWWGVVLVAIPVIVVSIVCFITARKSQYFREEDRALARVANLTLAHVTSGCTEEEISKLKKAFLKTREDKKFLHEHNALLEQEKDDLKSELRQIKEDLSDYKDKLKDERERYEDECPHKNRTKVKKPNESDEKIRKILVRVKAFQQHHKEKMERKDKEIAELKHIVEDTKVRENHLRGIINRLKESCRERQISHSEYKEYEPKHQQGKGRDDDDKFNDLMHDLLGTEKPKRPGDAGYSSSTEDSNLDLLREPWKDRHSENVNRYNSEVKKKERVYDDDEKKTDEAGHGFRQESGDSEAGRNRDSGFAEVEHKKKSDYVHRGKPKSGHGFGEWVKEFDPDDFNHIGKKKNVVDGAGSDEKLSAKRGKHYQNWKANEHQQTGGLAGNSEGLDKSRDEGMSTNVDQYDLWKQGHKIKSLSNEPLPNSRADLFSDTGYFGHGSDNPPPKHLSKEMIEGRKKIKVFFGKKEIKLHKDENKSKQPAIEKNSSKASNKGVSSDHFASKHMNDSHSKIENKSNNGTGKSVHVNGIDHNLGGNMSIQSLDDKIEQVTTVKKGAVKNFKMVLDGKQALSGAEKNPSTDENASEKKERKSKGTNKTTKKP